MRTAHGIHHVSAIAGDPQQNVDFYAGVLGLRLVKKTVNFDDPTGYHLYYGDEKGSPVDVRAVGGFLAPVGGAGTVHPVAFRAAGDDVELALRSTVVGLGLSPTPLIDREYFHSVYFREPGGVLFELATDHPRFTVDEPLERLGSGLMLPPRYEASRTEIEARLPDLHNPMVPPLASLEGDRRSKLSPANEHDEHCP